MPNTLAHVGAQSVATRLGVRGIDPKWVYLGCVIPDLPWILQRVLRVAIPGIDPFALRAYAIVQASLICSLLLCAAFALLSKEFGKAYTVLGLNVTLHLVLDATQTKWANGVHFVAPFSWTLTNWGLFWPESLVNYALTGFGLVYILTYWRSSWHATPDVGVLGARRWAGVVTLMGAYLLMPFLYVQAPIEADNHYLETLNTQQERTGRYVEFDRVRYENNPEGGVLKLWTSETVNVEGLQLSSPATVSVRGVFTDERSIRVIEHYVHVDWFRDGASYLGLVLIGLLWLQYLRKIYDEWLEDETGVTER